MGDVSPGHSLFPAALDKLGLFFLCQLLPEGKGLGPQSASLLHLQTLLYHIAIIAQIPLPHNSAPAYNPAAAVA